MSADPGARSLTVAIDHRFVAVDGHVYTDLAFATSYWTRYLAVYREVRVFARVTEQPRVPEGYVRADDHPSVVFLSAGGFRGARQLATALPALLVRAAEAARDAEAALIRNGVVSTAMWVFLVLSRRPYGKEVQGEIGESIKLTVSGSPWVAGRLAWLSDRLTRAQTRRAAAVAYVTPVLSRLYPPSGTGVVVHYSSVGLPAVPDVPSRHGTHRFTAPVALVSVGRLEREKGHDLLIRAVAHLRDEEGLDLTLRLVGDGSQRAALETLAADLDVSARIVFTGLVSPGAGVHEEIDRADLFVLPSRIEGTPRAVLEAMARGLPCMGTRVGGVPDLLPPSRLASPSDHRELARVISNTVRDDPARLSAEDQERVFELYGKEVMDTNWHRFHEAIIHA